MVHTAPVYCERQDSIIEPAKRRFTHSVINLNQSDRRREISRPDLKITCAAKLLDDIVDAITGRRKTSDFQSIDGMNLGRTMKRQSDGRESYLSHHSLQTFDLMNDFSAVALNCSTTASHTDTAKSVITVCNGGQKTPRDCRASPSHKTGAHRRNIVQRASGSGARFGNFE
jgi:hypothetical protein